MCFADSSPGLLLCPWHTPSFRVRRTQRSGRPGTGAKMGDTIRRPKLGIKHRVHARDLCNSRNSVRGPDGHNAEGEAGGEYSAENVEEYMNCNHVDPPVDIPASTSLATPFVSRRIQVGKERTRPKYQRRDEEAAALRYGRKGVGLTVRRAPFECMVGCPLAACLATDLPERVVGRKKRPAGSKNAK